MKQIISIILLLIAMFEGATVDTPDVKLDPDRVIFSSQYSNMAWGLQKKVIIVLGDGRTYSYNQDQMAEYEIYMGDGTKVLCASNGDWKYDIDDSNAKKVEKLWENRYLHYTDK